MDEKILIARFLQTNNYTQTLQAFVVEAGLPDDAGDTKAGDLSLEQLLQEKRTFDLSVSFEKLGTDEHKGWSEPSPTVASVVATTNPANLLSINHIHDAQSIDSDRIWTASADRRIICTNMASSELISSRIEAAPVLCFVQVGNIVLYGDMAGTLFLASPDGAVLDKRRDHTKYLVRISAFESQGSIWIATAAWDKSVRLYRLQPGSRSLEEPIAVLELLTRPEGLALVRGVDSPDPTLLLSRSDSNYIFYYLYRPPPSDSNSAGELSLVGKQNLAPHSKSWASFTPSDIVPCPTDTSVVAIATSSVPFMKLLIVKLLWPRDPTTMASSSQQSDPVDEQPVSSRGVEDSVAAARIRIAQQDREEHAILINCNTMAPQTQFSTPVVVWRPDGSGVFVNGEDGVVRGVDALSGKIVARLSGHEVGSKIRCLWAGQTTTTGEELLVSGGFDQRLIIWHCQR